AHGAAAHAGTQGFQGNTLQHRLEETLYNDTLRLVTRNATYHQVEELLFVDLPGSGTMTGAYLVGPDFQARNRLRTAFVTEQQCVVRQEGCRLLRFGLDTNHALKLYTRLIREYTFD